MQNNLLKTSVLNELSGSFHPIENKEYNEAYQWYEDRLEGLGGRFAEAIESSVEANHFKTAALS
jgi:hypothetical protein